MAHILQVRRRLSFKCVDEYSYLDKWGSKSLKFKFKVLAGRQVSNEVITYQVIGDKNLPHDLQCQVLKTAFTQAGCGHSYACRGCISRYASVRKLKAGVFSVRVRLVENI